MPSTHPPLQTVLIIIMGVRWLHLRAPLPTAAPRPRDQEGDCPKVCVDDVSLPVSYRAVAGGGGQEGARSVAGGGERVCAAGGVCLSLPPDPPSPASDATGFTLPLPHRRPPTGAAAAGSAPWRAAGGRLRRRERAERVAGGWGILSWAGGERGQRGPFGWCGGAPPWGAVHATPPPAPPAMPAAVRAALAAGRALAARPASAARRRHKAARLRLEVASLRAELAALRVGRVLEDRGEAGARGVGDGGGERARGIGRGGGGGGGSCRRSSGVAPSPPPLPGGVTAERLLAELLDTKSALVAAVDARLSLEWAVGQARREDARLAETLARHASRFEVQLAGATTVIGGGLWQDPSSDSSDAEP